MSHHPRIGVWLIPTDPYWVQVNEAVHQRAQQLRVDLIPLEPTIELMGNSEADQARLVEDILSFRLSALIAMYIAEQPLRRVLDTGLPIIHLTETELSHPNLVSSNGMYDCAFLAGQFVAKQLKGKGRLLVFGGLWEKVGERGQSRIKAIDHVVQAFPELSYQHIPTPWTYDQAYPVIEHGLKTNAGAIDALLGISDALALAACNAGRALGLVSSQTITVGINGDPLALTAVAKGTLTATVESDPASLGREAVDVACNIALKQPSGQRLDIHPVLVTAENIHEFVLKKLVSIADIPTRLIGMNRESEQLRMKQLETVVSINQQVGGLLDRTKLLDKVADLIRKHYGYSQVIVYSWLKPGQMLHREYPPPLLGDENQITLEQAGLIGKALFHGEAIFIPNARSRAILPIRYNQKVIGVLDLESSHRVQHFRHELLGLQLLADQIGIAEENASLYGKAITAQASAEKADQLKTRLLANVSHELRAPINLILGYCQLALKEPDSLPASLHRDLMQINQSGEHLVRLINDLLDMSRLEIGALDLYPEMFEPRPFLENVFKNMVDSAQQDGVTWRLDLPESLPLIQADEVRLRQILFNLLANASKFTNQGEIVLGGEVEPPHLHIWVADTGAGISPDDQDRIFEPFFRSEQLQRHRKGIGLGLSITRRLVALHGGFMSLESKLGMGSNFHVYLPLPGLTGPSMPTLPDSAAEPTLLLISHAPSLSANILQLSRRQGLRVERITSINDISRSHQPTMLAWDMVDSTPTDWELITQLRRFPHLCRLPFVVYNQRSGSSGLTNVLVKPVPQATLMEMLDSMHPAGNKNPMLVVDDDPVVRAMLARWLTEAFPGLPIQSADDGQMALEMLASFTPSLVVLDLMMPRMDGFRFLEHLRENARWQTVPVLVMSGKLLTEEDVRRLDYSRVVFQSKEMLTPEEVAAAFQNLLDDNVRLPQATSALVKRALAYIHQNYALPLSRQQIAWYVGVSERYLSEIFKQEMGISPWDVLVRFRIQRARELLKTSDSSITEIAIQVGFSDSSYFGRVFKKQTGLSPKAYRQQ